MASAFQTPGEIARLSHKLYQVSRRLQSLPLFSGNRKCQKSSLFLLLYSNKWSKNNRKSSFTINSEPAYELGNPQSQAYLQTLWQFLRRRAVIIFDLFPLQSLLLFCSPHLLPDHSYILKTSHTTAFGDSCKLRLNRKGREVVEHATFSHFTARDWPVFKKVKNDWLHVPAERVAMLSPLCYLNSINLSEKITWQQMWRVHVAEEVIRFG